EQFLPNLDKFLAEMPAQNEKDGAGGKTTTGMGSWEPVKIESKQLQVDPKVGPPNSYSISFPQGVIWGLLGCALSMGLTLVTERTKGTLVRLRMAPLPRWQVLGGKALACMALTVGVTVVLLLIAIPFGVRPVSPVGVVLAIVCSGVCFTGIMM